MRAWVNGSIRAFDEAAVPAFDHGLTVGDGVFETLKVVDGKPFALRRHLARLSGPGVRCGQPSASMSSVLALSTSARSCSIRASMPSNLRSERRKWTKRTRACSS